MSILRLFFGLNKWVRAFIVLLIFWGFLMYIFAVKLTVSNSTLEQENILERINQALRSLEGTKQKHDELKELVNVLTR